MSRLCFTAVTVLSITAMLACAVPAGDNSDAVIPTPSNTPEEERLAKPAQRLRLPNMGLPINGNFEYLFTVYLNETRTHFPSDPHIVFLYYDSDSEKKILQISRPTRDGQFETVFKMDTLDPDRPQVGWDELTVFPSFRLPGVVLWGSVLNARDEAKVVCYVDGRFQIVAHTSTADFLDLDGDGIPEIFTGRWGGGD